MKTYKDRLRELSVEQLKVEIRRKEELIVIDERDIQTMREIIVENENKNG